MFPPRISSTNPYNLLEANIANPWQIIKHFLSCNSLPNTLGSRERNVVSYGMQYRRQGGIKPTPRAVFPSFSGPRTREKWSRLTTVIVLPLQI